MFEWLGLCGDLDLTFLPRKLHPLGWMLKTCARATVGIVVRMELAECKDSMRDKKWDNDFGATCACTLRLVEPWFNSGRVIIADAWFGSVKCALELFKHGM
jgi:hypothetical protein